MLVKDTTPFSALPMWHACGFQEYELVVMLFAALADLGIAANLTGGHEVFLRGKRAKLYVR